MAKAKKFGAFSGVFTPSILTILGVIMFLRLPWIVGQAGLWATLGIILVAHIISLSTGLSVASVATDKRVETGGSYYIISRSLGLPIGGTLGIALFIGLSFSVSLYLIGFAETFLSYFGFEVSLYTIRIAGSVILFMVAVLTFISTSLAIKTQYLIMTAMVLSLVSVFFGNHTFSPSVPLMDGMAGALPWIALFAIFFPAVTGFEAGVSMSGDLKDPRKDIPFGTITAILVGLLVYIGLAFFFAFTVDRELLVGNPRVLFEISLLPQLVIAGILGATLSSALGSILGAPRILQAVAIDRILPGFLGKGFGASNEPRNALLLTYLIAQAGILIGELNVIARIVTIFFIITYGFLNITYAVESWAGTDFRPSFKIPRFVSVVGALACIIVMIQLDVIAMIVASAALIILFLILKRRELTLQTGDTWNSIWASLVKAGLGRLTISSRKARNWRPNIILFSGGESSRPHLIEMAKSLVGKLGIFTNFEIIQDPATDSLFQKMPDRIDKPAAKPGVFTRFHSSRDVYEGMDVISKIYGFSGFEPNTILMGWGRNTRNPEKFAELLRSFKKQDFNTVFLSYNKEAAFGKYRNIDVWWSGRGRNLSLAITLLRFLTSSKEWRGCRIRILCVNNNSSSTESLYSLVNQVLDNQRMSADVKVINNGVEQLPETEIIRAESNDADLCILELPDLGKKDPARGIENVNSITDQLSTCLLISASGFFDEISVKQSKPKAVKPGKHATEGPVNGILSQVIPASKEIIANEVYNIGSAAESIVINFYKLGFEPMLEKLEGLYTEMDFFAGKVLENLSKAIAAAKPAEQNKALLRLLNDFSYHSQKQIQQIKESLIPFERQCLSQAIQEFLVKTDQMLPEIPDKLWVRLQAGEFGAHKDDRAGVRLYKMRKRWLAAVTRKPVSHKIFLLPAVKYFIVYKRLEQLQTLMNDYALHSFQRAADIRNVFTSIRETLEKAHLGTIRNDAIAEMVRMEKTRLKARLGVLNDESKLFCYSLGQRLLDSLLTDLNLLGKHLESTGANMLSRNFSAYFRQNQKLSDTLASFPDEWGQAIDLYLNKVALDFQVLSLNSRMHAKLKKYHQDYTGSVKNTLLQAVGSLSELTKPDGFSAEKLMAHLKDPDNLHLQPALAHRAYEGLFDEIKDLLRELPEKIEIGGDQYADIKEDGRFPGINPVVINFRKSVSFFVGREFIDPVKKLVAETEQQLLKSVSAVKDLIRLMNFSLSEELIDGTGVEPGLTEDKRAYMVSNFHQRLTDEQRKVNFVLKSAESSFEKCIKNAFEPVSSMTFGKSGMAVKQQMRETPEPRFVKKIRTYRKQVDDFVEQQFVTLLYTKSEGMNWFRHFDEPVDQKSLSISDSLGFVEKISALPQLTKDLPFYYSTLFSGQAGIGDDFWVGMEAQIREADEAISRFKNGMPGAVIVTGARSSGKSSLSKLVARKHFSSDNIHQLRAPQACTSNIDAFQAGLLDALNARNNSLEDVFLALPPGKVIIIQDLGLWWERKPGGSAVIDCLKDLIDKFGHKCLFIITVNTFALQLLQQWSQIKSFALATVSCEPFDARELKDLILLRHNAGGLKLNYDKKDEEKMTAWDYARLFNNLFELSFGNPGTAINLWLASIKKVAGKTLYMETLYLPPTNIFDRLSPDQWFYVLQFVIHRRFTVDTLAANLELPAQRVYTDIRELIRSGILIEKFQGIYSIRPGLDLYLVDKLKTMKHL